MIKFSDSFHVVKIDIIKLFFFINFLGTRYSCVINRIFLKS